MNDQEKQAGVHLFNDFHMGDCLYLTQFAKKLAEKHRISVNLYVNPAYHNDLRAVAAEKPVFFFPTNDRPGTAINTWIGDNQYWHRHPLALEYDNFYVEWFGDLSQRLRLETPINSKEDLLLDAVASPEKIYDFLVVNSTPLSGQWHGSASAMENFMAQLVQVGYKVASTHPSRYSHFCTILNGMNLQQLSNFSTQCQRIVGVCNAPIHATLNRPNVLGKETEWWICDQGVYFTYSDRLHPVTSDHELLALRFPTR